MAFIQPLGQLRSPVSTYASLPLTGNVRGDLRISTDTGDAYTWMLVASSGSLTDWNKVTTAAYSDLIGAPYSTALDIDNAVKVTTGLAINISLLAFNTLTSFGSAVARMFDGMVHQFNSEETGLEQDECENHIQIDETYYMPNKGDLDINTKMLIHGDGIQGSSAFMDLLRLPLYNHGAITDTTTKKFGTGSIKFDGVNDSCDLGRLVEGTAQTMFGIPMTFDFWLYSNASGLQPIVSNEEYIAEQYYQTSYAAGEVVDIKKNASNKIEATVLVRNGYDINGEVIVILNVVGSTTVSSNAWHHVAIQRTDVGYLNIYLDGVLDGTSALFCVPLSNVYFPVVLTLGKLGAAYLNGYLDEIRLSNIVRYSTSFTPMTKAYNTATTPAPTPVIEDISAGNKTVTALGNARMSGTNPLFGNASLYLDGINSYLTLADSDDWMLSEGISGVDAYIKLLLHFDNNLDDSELTPKTVTNNGCTFPVPGKFGGYAANFNGSSYLSVPDSDDFNFGSDSFTIDWWVNFNVKQNSGFFQQYDNPGSRFTCYYNYNDGGGPNNLITVSINSGGGWILLFHVNFEPTVGQWYHMALIRDGNTWNFYVDGIALTKDYANGDYSNTLPDYSGQFIIGQYSSVFWVNGLIDEFRVSKGIARWTSNFTPPTSPTVDTSTDYTIDLWIDPLSLTDLDTFIIGQEDSWKLTLDGTSNKYLKYTIVDGASVIAPIALSLETWQHIAIVQKDGVIKLYVNGILGAAITGTVTINGTNILSIGASNSGENLFNGFIEEVRISDNARWSTAFTPPSVEYSCDSNTKLLLPLNVQTVPNMVLQSVGYVSNYVPTSARVVIFEEDIDAMEPNVDLKIEISRDGGVTFSPCLIAKDQEFGDGTLNLFTGSVDLDTQPHGELLVWKLTTQNNKDCRIRGISLNWR